MGELFGLFNNLTTSSATSYRPFLQLKDKEVILIIELWIQLIVEEELGLLFNSFLPWSINMESK